MIKCDKVQKGLANYLDNELVTKLEEDSVQKVLISVAISLYIKKFSDMIMSIRNNKAIQVLGIIDANGNIDIDTLKTEIEKQIPETGIKIDLPMVGTITIHKIDIQTLYEYIMESAA